jgi:hypothetical protein
MFPLPTTILPGVFILTLFGGPLWGIFAVLASTRIREKNKPPREVYLQNTPTGVQGFDIDPITAGLTILSSACMAVALSFLASVLVLPCTIWGMCNQGSDTHIIARIIGTLIVIALLSGTATFALIKIVSRNR